MKLASLTDVLVLNGKLLGGGMLQVLQCCVDVAMLCPSSESLFMSNCTLQVVKVVNVLNECENRFETV